MLERSQEGGAIRLFEFAELAKMVLQVIARDSYSHK